MRNSMNLVAPINMCVHLDYHEWIRASVGMEERNWYGVVAAQQDRNTSIGKNSRYYFRNSITIFLTII